MSEGTLGKPQHLVVKGEFLRGAGGPAMRCPWCGHPEDKVVDSRTADAGAAVRRRRQCLRCGRRFTTFERVEEARLSVIKREGKKEPFDRDKIIVGITKAIKNRPVTAEQVEQAAARVEDKLRRKGPAVTTQEVGLEVLSLLRRLDDVAYLRFASVYKDFQELTDFERELGILLQKKDVSRVGSASMRKGRSPTSSRRATI
jgi:transcriptional repressor NrdR